MHNTDSPLLPEGAFPHRQAEVIVAAYQNVAIEDDQGHTFDWPFATAIIS